MSALPDAAGDSRAPSTPDAALRLSNGVGPTGPAESAGLREGDLLITANGRDLRTPDDLFAALDALGDDEALSLQVVRGVEDLDVAVRFDANGGEHGAA